MTNCYFRGTSYIICGLLGIPTSYFREFDWVVSRSNWATIAGKSSGRDGWLLACAFFIFYLLVVYIINLLLYWKQNRELTWIWRLFSLLRCFGYYILWLEINPVYFSSFLGLETFAFEEVIFHIMCINLNWKKVAKINDTVLSF